MLGTQAIGKHHDYTDMINILAIKSKEYGLVGGKRVSFASLGGAHCPHSYEGIGIAAQKV